MRLTTLLTDGGPRVGLLDGDLVRLLEPGPTLQDVVAGGPEAVAEVPRRVRDAVGVEDAAFGPLLAPPSVRDFLTYERHLAALAGSVPEEWYEQPLFYFSNPAAIVAPYGEVPMPPFTAQYDYELELEVAAVVGRAGADLTPEQAQDHVLGYTIMNDWSARDLQVHEFKFPMGPSKSKDAAITLGPWLVTADELADHVVDGRLALATEVRLNGQRTGGDSTANMSWSFADLVAYASRGTVVRPGDVLGSGTCGTDASPRSGAPSPTPHRSGWRWATSSAWRSSSSASSRTGSWPARHPSTSHAAGAGCRPRPEGHDQRGVRFSANAVRESSAGRG